MVFILVQLFGVLGLSHGIKICSSFVLFLILFRFLTSVDQFQLPTTNLVRHYKLQLYQQVYVGKKQVKKIVFVKKKFLLQFFK